MKRKKYLLPNSSTEISSTTANRFVNILVRRGKKNNAYRLLLDSLMLSERLSESSQPFKQVFNPHQKLQKKTGYLNTLSKTIRANLHKQESLEEKSKVSSQERCVEIINNIKPNLETRKVRRGATIYQVPCILSYKRQEGIAIRWLISAASSKNSAGKNKNKFSERLGEEFLSTLNKSGQCRQKRDQLHNLAAINRSNIRYRWW